jgi:hypothetical protein
MKMGECTFILFQDIEGRLQKLINTGLVKRSEVLELLEDGLTEFDWYQFGYDVAAGDRGTGWMAIGEVGEYEGMDTGEVLEDVEKWCDTDAWNDEVGNLMRELNEDDVDSLICAKDSWVEGYASYVIDKLEETNELVEAA